MKRFQFALLLVGCVLLYWVIQKTGTHQLWMSLTTLGWRIIYPIVLVLISYIFATAGWWIYLKRFDHGMHFGDLLWVRLAGEATNTLTPVNFAGGDPIRIWLLSHHLSPAQGGASVVIDRTVQIFSTILLIAIGTLIAIFKLSLPRNVDLILAGTIILLLFLTSLLLRQQNRGFFASLARWTLRWPKVHKVFEQLKETDDLMSDFYQKERKLFALCLLFHIACRLMGMVEVYLLSYFLGISMNWWQALFFTAVFPVVNFLGAIVPGAIGVMEGVVSALFFAMHWNPADGLALQIARRLRAAFWIAVGLLVLVFSKKQKKVES